MPLLPPTVQRKILTAKQENGKIFQNNMKCFVTRRLTVTIANRKYKDSLFRFIFGSEERKENTLALYNAINGTSYTDVRDLELTTLEDVIYISMKNDVSFLISEDMNLYEQQSTWNPNMPLRGLLYFSKLYAGYIEKNELDMYGTKSIPLPTPKYVILYNGQKTSKFTDDLRLSDMYEGEGSLEVVANVIDINYSEDKEILKACRALEEYSGFVAIMKENIAKGTVLGDAIDKTIEECIQKGILADILRHNRMEVKEMLFTMEDAERAMKVHEKAVAKEAAERGRAEGMEKGMERGMHLFKCMKKDERLEEFEKAMDDEELLNSLLQEYNIV